MTEAAPTARRSGLRRNLKKLLLGTLFTWILFELIVLPRVPRHLPLRVRMGLPAPMRLIGQRSLRSFPPSSGYVLLLGDSYAEGNGDWRGSVRHEYSPTFCPAHLIAESTRVDVLNLGRGGASSVASTAYLASKRMASLWRCGLRDPSAVIVQFYAGNDLEGNIDDYVADTDAELTDTGVTRATTARDYIDSRASEGYWRGVGGTFMAPYVFTHAYRQWRISLKEPTEWPGITHTAAEAPVPERNGILIDGRIEIFDGQVEGPATGLTDDDLDLAYELLDESLRWVKERFEGVPILVVYLPSPVATYELVSPAYSVQCMLERRSSAASPDEIRSKSLEMRRRVAAIARGNQLDFIDTTAALQSAARRQLVHGRSDAQHFNRLGYEIVAEEIRPWVSALDLGRSDNDPDTGDE